MSCGVPFHDRPGNMDGTREHGSLTDTPRGQHGTDHTDSHTHAHGARSSRAVHARSRGAGPRKMNPGLGATYPQTRNANSNRNTTGIKASASTAYQLKHSGARNVKRNRTLPACHCSAACRLVCRPSAGCVPGYFR
jgi:hypothetical protein